MNDNEQTSVGGNPITIDQIKQLIEPIYAEISESASEAGRVRADILRTLKDIKDAVEDLADVIKGMQTG